MTDPDPHEHNEETDSIDGSGENQLDYVGPETQQAPTLPSPMSPESGVVLESLMGRRVPSEHSICSFESEEVEPRPQQVAQQVPARQRDSGCDIEGGLILALLSCVNFICEKQKNESLLNL